VCGAYTHTHIHTPAGRHVAGNTPFSAHELTRQFQEGGRGGALHLFNKCMQSAGTPASKAAGAAASAAAAAAAAKAVSISAAAGGACVAVCCRVLQCDAMCCSVLQCVAVRYSVL